MYLIKQTLKAKWKFSDLDLTYWLQKGIDSTEGPACVIASIADFAYLWLT